MRDDDALTADSGLARDPFPLRGRAVLVTGVSRRAGIGYAIARRVAAWGGDVFVQHHRPHDLEQPWGGDDLAEVVAGIERARGLTGTIVGELGIDLARSDAAAELVAAASHRLGRLDALVANHARSGEDGTLAEISTSGLDAHWAVNARATILLAQAFAARHAGADGEHDGGRLIMMSSGQQLGAMRGELAYAASKGALVGILATLAEELAPRGITVNVVNPGPVDTGYADDETREGVRALFPLGRWGEPDDPARLVVWLLTDEARWVTGQLIDSEGGFRRS